MIAGLIIVAGALVIGAVYAARSRLRTLSSRQQLAYLIASTVAAISVLAGAFLAFLAFEGTCDESCDPSTGLWIDDPEAYQWDLLGALFLGLAVLAVALCVCIARQWIVAAWVVAAGYAALVTAHIMLVVSGAPDDVKWEGTDLLYPFVVMLLVGGEIASAWLARRPAMP